MRDFAISPYRTDGESSNEIATWYYDVADAQTNVEFSDQLAKFLKSHEAFLQRLRDSGEVEHIDLDIGMTIPDSRLSVSVDLDSVLICRAGNLGLAISLAVYLESASLDERGKGRS